MKILVDIGHPAHVHLYRNLIKNMTDERTKFFIIIRNVSTIRTLMKFYGLKYFNLFPKKDGLINKIFNQFKINYLISSYIKKHNINLCIGSTPAIAQISKLTKSKSILFDDDDDAVEPLIIKFVHPFCSSILSPISLKGNRKNKRTTYYSGYHELAYLHPNRFTPDSSVLQEAGLIEGEKYFIMRFNVFKAHHDLGVKGISLENKLKLVELLSKFGKVFITTERDIEPELKEYQYKLHPAKIHSFLYYATMFIGDSQTMTSEASVLGTPAIRCNSFVGRISYLEEEEHKYRLTFGFKPKESDKMFNKITELLNIPNLKEEWHKRRRNMLADKIDVTAFFIWFIENYPESVEIMRREPSFQERFR